MTSSYGNSREPPSSEAVESNIVGYRSSYARSVLDYNPAKVLIYYTLKTSNKMKKDTAHKNSVD